MENKLVLRQVDDETVQIILNGRDIYTATHDVDGWHGIMAVLTVARGIATDLAIDVIEQNWDS